MNSHCCLVAQSCLSPWDSMDCSMPSFPWTEEPGGLQSTGLQRAGHNWATNTTQQPQPPASPTRHSPEWSWQSRLLMYNENSIHLALHISLCFYEFIYSRAEGLLSSWIPAFSLSTWWSPEMCPSDKGRRHTERWGDVTCGWPQVQGIKDADNSKSGRKPGPDSPESPGGICPATSEPGIPASRLWEDKLCSVQPLVCGHVFQPP